MLSTKILILTDFGTSRMQTRKKKKRIQVESFQMIVETIIGHWKIIK